MTVPIVIALGRGDPDRTNVEYIRLGPIFRAYDKRTGEVVAEITVPANPSGSSPNARVATGGRPVSPSP